MWTVVSISSAGSADPLHPVREAGDATEDLKDSNDEVLALSKQYTARNFQAAMDSMVAVGTVGT
jgi:hypothetical protein